MEATGRPRTLKSPASASTNSVSASIAGFKVLKSDVLPTPGWPTIRIFAPRASAILSCAPSTRISVMAPPRSSQTSRRPAELLLGRLDLLFPFRGQVIATGVPAAAVIAIDEDARRRLFLAPNRIGVTCGAANHAALLVESMRVESMRP